MSGAFDFTVFIEGKTMRQVAQFVSEKLSPMESVLSTATHFVLKKYKVKGTGHEINSVYLTVLIYTLRDLVKSHSSLGSALNLNQRHNFHEGTFPHITRESSLVHKCTSVSGVLFWQLAIHVRSLLFGYDCHL